MAIVARLMSADAAVMRVDDPVFALIGSLNTHQRLHLILGAANEAECAGVDLKEWVDRALQTSEFLVGVILSLAWSHSPEDDWVQDALCRLASILNPGEVAQAAYLLARSLIALGLTQEQLLRLSAEQAPPDLA